MENNKKQGNVIIKDAAILFAITLVAGLLLGFVYDITKDPIQQQEMAGKITAYQALYPDAADFSYNEEINSLIENSEELFINSGADFGNVTIDEVVEVTDASSQMIGYVISATSKDGYNGNIGISVGITADGVVTGIEMLELNETVGFGMQAADAGFKNQYKGKQVDYFTITKNGKSADNEIDALSGATITSTAVTNAVNAALYFIRDCINR